MRDPNLILPAPKRTPWKQEEADRGEGAALGAAPVVGVATQSALMVRDGARPRMRAIGEMFLGRAPPHHEAGSQARLMDACLMLEARDLVLHQKLATLEFGDFQVVL